MVYVLQCYEWITMIYIIKYQKGKTLGEILYADNNEKFHREIKYKYNEKIIAFITFLYIILQFGY